MSEWLHWPKWSKNSSVSRITSRKKPRSSACVVSSFKTTPSMVGGFKSILPVGAVGAHEVVGRVVGGPRFSRISPEPFQEVVLNDALLQAPVVHVAEFHLRPT